MKDKWTWLGIGLTITGFACNYLSGKKTSHDIQVAATEAAEKAVKEAMKNGNTTSN